MIRTMAPNPIAMEMVIDIQAPPPMVWDRLVDWENLGSWMLEGSGFEVIGPRREGVGTRATATISIGGIKTKDPIRVVRWEPPNVLEMEHLGWVKGMGTMRLFPKGEGTHLFWREVLIPPWGIIGDMGIRVFKPMMRKVFVRDLNELKLQMEQDAPPTTQH